VYEIILLLQQVEIVEIDINDEFQVCQAVDTVGHDEDDEQVVIDEMVAEYADEMVGSEYIDIDDEEVEHHVQ
jgi:phosphatidylglycerophosphatase A